MWITIKMSDIKGPNAIDTANIRTPSQFPDVNKNYSNMWKEYEL
jgi:hypothetical protein